MKKIPLNERIIFALDVSSPKEAEEWVVKLDNDIKFFKVGLELFLAGWWNIIEFIVGRGNKVMVDLKFFDIDITVHRAVQQLKERGVTFATIHGNENIIKKALENRGDLKILAVTVLTSFDQSDLEEMGLTGTIQDLVLIRSKKAISLGCDGVVASPKEVEPIRKELGSSFLIVTPGIRSDFTEVQGDDQKRIDSAKNAIINGADYVVIGRPIRDAKDPVGTVKKLQDEIAQALTEA